MSAGPVGETAYEPDVLVLLEAHKPAKKALAVPTAHVEKDRTGILTGQTISWPTFAMVAEPLLGLLGGTQLALLSDEEVGQQDAEALAKREAERRQHSAELATAYTARFTLAETVTALQQVGAELTVAVKKELAAHDLARVRSAYADRLAKLKAHGSNGTVHGHGTEPLLPSRNGA